MSQILKVMPPLSQLIAAYETGISLAQVAKQFNISSAYVSKKFIAASYALRPAMTPEKKRESHREQSRNWCRANREKDAAASRKWYAANRARKTNYDLAHREYHLENVAQNYVANKSRYQQNNFEYLRTPHGKSVSSALHHKRRVTLRVQGTHSPLSSAELQKVYENNILKYQTLTCCLCFEPINFGEDSLEHLTPISRHAEFPEVDLNALSNLGVAHISCNCKKHGKTLSEWFQKYPEYLQKCVF